MNTKEVTKTKVIAFRVTEDEWNAVESLAFSSGENPNDWARSLILAEAGKRQLLNRSEQMIFEELARVRFLLGNAFGLSAAGQLTTEAWEHVRKESAERAAEHAKVLLSRYESRWFFGDAGLAVVEDNAPEA